MHTQKLTNSQKLFEVVLDDLNNGNTPMDLTEALQEVVAGVKATGKVGKVVFTIKVKPGSRGEVQTVEIEDDIKTVVPMSDRAKSFFFITKDNELSRKNPNQPELDLRTIEQTGPEPLRKIGS